MNPCATLVRRAAALLAFTALATVASSAHALVTYTYTGPAFNSFDIGDPAHPVTASGLVASFVFNDFLGANVGSTDNYQLVMPLSWSVSGGGYSLASGDAGATLESVGVFTDAGGAVQGWDYFAYLADGLDDIGPRFRSFLYPTGQFTTSGPAIKVDVMAYWNVPTGISSGENTSLSAGGSWSVTAAVPEPGSAALLLAGGAALGWLVRRRARA